MSDALLPYLDALIAQLTVDEGKLHFVYDDATGKSIGAGDGVKGNPTVGIGRNLASVGLSADEIDYLVRNDIGRVVAQLDASLPWWRSLTEGRQMAMINLTFNMGMGMLFVVPAAKFKKAQSVLDRVGEKAYTIGRIVKGERKVTYS